MIAVYYLLDNRKAYKGSKTVPLLADVKYSYGDKSEHFRFSVGISCNPKNFDRQTIHGRESNAGQKIALLDKIRQTSEAIYLDGLQKGQMPDREVFKIRIKGALQEAEIEKTTLNHFDDYLAHIKSRKKSPSFIVAMNKLREALVEMRDNGNSIRLEDVNLNFETKFRTLLNERDYKTNTIGAYIKRLKMFLNWCAKNNLHQNQMYKLFQIEEESREIIALSETEVQMVADLKIPTHKHIEAGGTKLVRDWLIIATQTGLRYSDFPKVAAPKLVPVTGGFDLHVKTQKTKQDVVIPVSRLLYQIFEEHDFNVPLPPSNQKFNAGLKRVAEKANLGKVISSHTGRKTFCTINYRRGVPVPQIMKISGHKTEKEFYKYIGVSLTENAALVRVTSTDFQIEGKPKMAVNKKSA